MLTKDELDELLESIKALNELNLNEKDFILLRHFLGLVRAWKIRTELIKKKERSESLKIERGMTFSNCEKRIKDEYAR